MVPRSLAKLVQLCFDERQTKKRTRANARQGQSIASLHTTAFARFKKVCIAMSVMKCVCCVRQLKLFRANKRTPSNH